MSLIDSHITAIDKVICANIQKFTAEERGLLSQNILSQLRNFVESIALKIYSNGNDIEITYPNIEKSVTFIKSRGDLKFLNRFHKLLQITTSHYTIDEEGSERLMLKYYEYLLKSKIYLKNTYNLDVLDNLDSFPIITDSILDEYYSKIAEKISQPEYLRVKSKYDDRYYIQKIKPFFVNHNVYYEITFTTAYDKASKFDRIIAFTKLDILHNYAVKLTVSKDRIQILDKNMPILIIDSWEVSIRPCELNNFGNLFGNHPKLGGTVEYYELMQYLTTTGLSLVEFIDFSDYQYEIVKSKISERTKSTNIFTILNICRNFTKNNLNGTNIIRYLLYRLNNKIIKKQYKHEPCNMLSDLYLDFGCIPFDKMPFNTSLRGHNPRLSDLFDCINPNNHEHELFARLIKNNIEIKGQLYTPIKEVQHFNDIDSLINKFNAALYYTHTNRKIEKFQEHAYIKGYEEDTFQIIQKLKELSAQGLLNYSNSVNAWLNSSAYHIDCEEKDIALKQMFENSKVSLIYGAAGTGKSTMINHISNFFNNEQKLYLTNTNPAVENLRRRVNASNCTFKTITKFLYNNINDYDILIIDECSTVSNSDMLNVLNRAKFKLLVLVGDVYQIESILFGNWFSVARSFLPNSSVFELTKPYRSINNNLLTFWNKVRNLDVDILEHIARNQYSLRLDESIFVNSEEDEIILCLNYDGLYGINNINRFLQSNNPNIAIEWGVHTYKINDPIIFNESERFTPLIYNNLKGKIKNINTFEDRIQFEIEIDKVINQLNADLYDFELVGSSANGNSIISFFVNKFVSTDEDDETVDTTVPFQVAYAVSIHKAQGLEYNSVKIVITDEVEELITHNIFYTAITRAKNKLRIYWTPETENKIFKDMSKKLNGKDVALLKTKFNL